MGSKRFRKPERLLKRWEEPLLSTKERSSCPQLDLSINMSEDCLYLNIWAPSTERLDGKQLPVLVFIPGGISSED